MTSQQIFESILNDTLKPIFKSNSFKTPGQCFYQDAEDFKKLFQVQKSRSNTADSIKFTFNIGIFDKIAYIEFHDGALLKNPKPNDCVINTRIGYLLPSKKDIWYIIESYASKENIEMQIKNDISLHCLPYFDKFKSKNDLLSEYLTTENPFIKNKNLTLDLHIAIHILSQNILDQGLQKLQE